MKKERYLISDLKLDTAVAYSAILSLRITSGQGEHGRLYITLEVDEGLSQSDVLRYNDTNVAVSLSDGRKIFSGVCTGASLSNQGQYKCVMMEACTRSVKMDSERKKAVFQDPGKTLQDILGTVCASYGAVLSLDSDPAMKNVEYQQDETDWAFLKRLSAAQQKAVFTDLSGGGINIYCGETGFRSFGGDILAEQCGSSRNVSELARAGELESVSGYMFDTVEYLSAEPCASAGDLVDGKYCVRRSELTLDGGALTNRLWLGYSDSMRPSVDESTQPSFMSGVLQGTVLAVSGNQVQVQFDSDAGGGSAMWIPYESAISNSFYCMPDEGDRVFVYQENDGKAVCLGSRHVETGRPDFTKPKEDVLTNHDKMVKLGETALTITATRDAHDSGSGDEITIHMDSDEGITISSGKDIYIMTAANMNIGARVPEDADEMQKEGHDRVKERDAEGDATYSVESLEYFGGAALGGLLKESARQFGEDVKQQAIDTIKAMTFADLWFPKTENAAVGSEEAFETGVVTLYGYDHLVLSVGENRIELGADDISITTDKFYWLGYERQKHSPEEIPLKDWWETALDGLQLVLDIAGMIPVFGAIPDLINAGVSLARGNYVEAAMSAFAAIPGIGDAAGALKTGAKVVKTVTKLTKAEKIIKTIQLLYQGLQLAYSVYQNREAIANIWNKLTTGTLDLRNIDDVNDLLSVLNLAPGMVQFGMDANNLRKGQKVDYSVDGPDKKLDAQTTNSDNDYCATDPVNVVTGSLVADYDDLQLRDIRETFILRRTYESAYENKGLLLGSRWFLNIESRTAMEGDTMKVQLPDMHLLSFRRTGDGGWENMKAGDRSMELTDTADGMQLKDNRGRKTYRYTKDGRLESVSDRYGNTTRFLYEGGVLYRMELAGGQYLDFEMKNGRLDTIRDTMGRTYRYEYEGELLTCVTLANGGKIRYEYTSEGWMKRITDQNGKCYVSNEYDLRGRVVKQTTADGGEYAMFYDAAKHCNTFTDLATGEVTRYEYGRQRVPTRTIYADGTYTETRYDEWENKIYERDRNGAETFRSFDRYGNLLEERLPSGLATTNTYDDGGNIIRQTDSMGREVRWEYDEKGMLTGEHMLLDRDTWCSMRFEWDRHGRLLKETNPNGNETRYRYDTMFSEPSARILPEGGTTWYTYDAAGRMTELRDALGTVRYSYNRTDAVTEVVDRTGGITRYGYDRLGNKTRETRPEQHESGKGTVYEYDCLDHLVRVTTPEGSVYAYRKGSDDRLLKAVSPNAYDPETGDGDGMAFDHDATGRRIRVHYPDGGCERYFLDGNGNITKRVQPEQYDEEKDDGAGYAYEYDTAGRLTRITDPYGRQVRQYAYDEAGYITRSTDARMGETLYRYNLAGWLVEKREQTGRGEDGTASYRLTTYTYDNMGNRLTEKRYTMPQEITGMSGATHTIRYEYDRDNRLVKVSDCTGAAVTYHYGKHGLVDRERVRTGGDAWKETRYLYDAQGRVTKTAEVLSDGVYSITEYAYDRNGNITGVTMPEGGRIGYAYDAEDRLIYEAHECECISSSLTYAYDKTGNLVSVTDADGHTETYDYDLLNRETRRTARDGGVQETLYDKNGNAVRRINPVQYLSDKSGLTYSYDLCNRLSRVTSPAGSILEENTYNAAGDLLRRTDGMGNGVSMAYDLMGRRLSAATAAGSTQQWEYDANGNVRASTDGCGNRTEFTLDKWGRITGIRKADGSHESYTYDLMGNMTSSTDGEGHTTLMEYDTSGQMVKRTDPSGKTEYYGYDREKRLVSSTDRNGSTTRYTYNMYGSLTGRVTTSADRERTITESFGYYPDGKLCNVEFTAFLLMAYPV